MDNETTAVVNEETARPVKKLVLKRKPVMKKAKIKEELPESASQVAETVASEPSEKVEAPAQAAPEKTPESEQAPKKRRGRSKQKAENPAGESKEESKDNEQVQTQEAPAAAEGPSESTLSVQYHLWLPADSFARYPSKRCTPSLHPPNGTL